MVRILSALALGAMMSFALAQPLQSMDVRSGPMKLTSAQMDRVAAGQGGQQRVYGEYRP